MSSESDYEMVDAETRSFVDDMYDEHIRALAFRPYNPSRVYRTSLINRKGAYLCKLDQDQVWAIGRYCQHLIESGIIKAKIFPTKDNSADDNAKHIGIINYVGWLEHEPAQR